MGKLSNKMSAWWATTTISRRDSVSVMVDPRICSCHSFLEERPDDSDVQHIPGPGSPTDGDHG